MQPQRCGGPAKRDSKQRHASYHCRDKRAKPGLDRAQIGHKGRHCEMRRCAECGYQGADKCADARCAIPTGIPTLVVCIGEKPSESNVAYWRHLSA
jgi:hypothetical protein